MPGQKSFYVVLYHNDFSPSNEQHKCVLADTLWQPTYGYIAKFQNYCCFTKHEGYYEKLNSTKSLGIYYWYVKIQCTPDISRSCISRNWTYCGHMLEAHFLAPKSAIFFEIVVTPWTQFAGDNKKQFFAKSTAVRWAAMLDRALSPPLCHRVRSS